MNSNRRSGSIYLWVLVAAGLPFLLHAAFSVARSGQLSWLWLAGLTAVAGTLSIKIPLRLHQGHSITVSVVDCFVLLAFIVFDVNTAVLVAAVATLASCLRVALRRPDRYLFNLAQFGLAAWITGSVYQMLRSGPFQASFSWVAQGFLLIAFSAVFFFVLNTGAVAVAIALSRGESIWDFWSRHFPGLCLPEALNLLAALAFLLAVSPERSLSLSIWLVVGAALLLFSNFYSRRWRHTLQVI